MHYNNVLSTDRQQHLSLQFVVECKFVQIITTRDNKGRKQQALQLGLTIQFVTRVTISYHMFVTLNKHEIYSNINSI